jgi:hypothetical protein
MGVESKYFAQIPDYLEDLLSPEEKEAFEHQLERDEHLVQEVNLHREVAGSLANSDLRGFREKLERFNRETPVIETEIQNKNRSISLRVLITIAASLLLLVVLATWVLQSDPSAEDQVTAYLENYDPANVLPPAYIAPDRTGERAPNVAPADTSEKDPLHEARIFFSRKQYPEALAVMKTIDPKSLPNENAYWYELGVLYLLNDQPLPTVEALKKINAPALEEAQRWHLALAYWKLDRLEEARSALQPLLDQPNPWQEEAKVLNGAL